MVMKEDPSHLGPQAIYIYTCISMLEHRRMKWQAGTFWYFLLHSIGQSTRPQLTAKLLGSIIFLVPRREKEKPGIDTKIKYNCGLTT